MNKTAPYKKLLDLITSEKKEVYNIYIFALLNGIIQLTIPLGVQSIIGFILGGAFSTSLVVLISFMMLGVLLSGIFQIQQMKVIERLQQKIFHYYAFNFKNNTLSLDLKKSDNTYFPELMNRFLDVSGLQKGLSKILLDIPLASIQIFLGLIIVAIFHPLFLIMVLVLLLFIVLIFVITSKKGLETSIKESSYKYEVTSWLEEIARMVSIFKINRSYGLAENFMDQKVQNYLDYRTKHFKILLYQFKNLIFLKLIITGVMLILGTYLLINQQLNVGQFVAAEIIIIMMINSVEKVIVNLDSFYDLLTSIDKLSAIDNEPKENEGLNILPQYSKGMEVEFSNVSFSYNEDIPIFEESSFVINSGEKIAISGKEGAGKSTLLRLFSSTYAPNTGTIIFNDIPIHNLAKTEFRENISMMLNKLDIFKGSIIDNITMGNNSIKLHDIIDMAKEIGLDDYINHTKDGYYTMLDTVGKRLPKTIIKKIIFLRTVIAQKPLILLEDPFSELSDKVIKAMQHILLHKLPHSTVIIVNSDEHFTNQCDRVIEINDRKITISNNR